MARTKRSELPNVTEHDRQTRPSHVRPTPNGGWAWTCHYCRRFASSMTARGRFVCRCHGGTTPRQRDRLLWFRHYHATGVKLRPPGRPLRHGLYSSKPKVNVAEVVREYRARQATGGAYARLVRQERERAERDFHRLLRRLDAAKR